ncbi:MAG TPA: porin [Paracoccus sp. (in: a-proteobacteria)]|nr:porin [Paracoccus sp. (in: a-proteobacteria)]
MKKLLLATSALVALAGGASAEVAVTGDGRMGLVYDGDSAQFSSRARAKFNLTGETDSGLSFGGAFRVDEENYSANPEGRSAAHGTDGYVFISGSFGKLSMGDVVSASEAAIGDLPELGYTAGEFAADPEEIDYLTGDGQNEEQGPTALYEYTISGVKLFASLSDGSRRNCDATIGSEDCYDFADDDADVSDMAYSLAAAYEFGAYNVGLGYAKWGDASEIVLGGTAAIDAFKIKAFYAMYDDRDVGGPDSDLNNDDEDFGDFDLPLGSNYDKSYGVSVEYAMSNGIGLQALWMTREIDLPAAAGDFEESYDAYGIGASYELGTGVTLAGAIIKNELFAENETRADMGVKFSF